ncbi:MAG: hypothetical protein OXC65_11765 [Thiotrichales bacterium]|nr:hypothetical protein [Thiotrichales bacterium]
MSEASAPHRRCDPARSPGPSRPAVRAAVLALLLANTACATQTAEPVFDPDPVLHPPGGRIVFNRMCADEESHRVKAYARMESPDGRARAVVAVLVGYPAMGGKTVRVDVRLQRLKLDAADDWRNAPFTIRLVARRDRALVEGPEIGAYMEDEGGERRFRTSESGTLDWMTFVEPDDEEKDSDRFYRHSPNLGFKAPELGTERPGDEFDLALMLHNRSNGRTFELSGPRVRIPERLRTMDPPTPKALGLVETLNPSQEGGLFDFLSQAWKYRECIEERRAAKRFLGPYTPSAQRDGG